MPRLCRRTLEQGSGNGLNKVATPVYLAAVAYDEDTQPGVLVDRFGRVACAAKWHTRCRWRTRSRLTCPHCTAITCVRSRETHRRGERFQLRSSMDYLRFARMRIDLSHVAAKQGCSRIPRDRRGYAYRNVAKPPNRDLASLCHNLRSLRVSRLNRSKVNPAQTRGNSVLVTRNLVRLLRAP